MMQSVLKHIRVIWTFVSLLLLAIGGVSLAMLVSDNDLSSRDSDAIFGGEREFGYPSTGYILSYKNNVEATICGAVQLDSDLLLTAAHCINNISNVFYNADDVAGQISLTESDADYFKKDEWDGVDPRNDLAAILYSSENQVASNFASISEPEIGCGYRVVGFGRTEEDDGVISTVRDKKSARLCIQDFDSDIIVLEGEDGGICLGDSGSPIFRDGTNQLVGIISSVVSVRGGDSCFIGNRAVAVRVDSNIDFINNVALGNIETVSPSENEISEVNEENTIINSSNRISNSTDFGFDLSFDTQDGSVFGLPLEIIQTVYFVAALSFTFFVIRVWLGSSGTEEVQRQAKLTESYIEPPLRI